MSSYQLVLHDSGFMSRQNFLFGQCCVIGAQCQVAQLSSAHIQAITHSGIVLSPRGRYGLCKVVMLGTFDKCQYVSSVYLALSRFWCE